MQDKAVAVIGFAVQRLREFFSPGASVPPLGGGTETVWILAGDVVVPPPWVGVADDDSPSCEDCDPYLWVRMVRRWRTRSFPDYEEVAAKCGLQQAVTIEAGIARCHPYEPDPCEAEKHAAVQWDDAWRIDNALCQAMNDAIRAGAAQDSALGSGEPTGPDGMVLVWSQLAHAQL